MPQKRHKPEEIVAKLRQVELLSAQGRPIVEAVRSIGVTEVTYYRWRNEYGGLILLGDGYQRLHTRRQMLPICYLSGRPQEAALSITCCFYWSGWSDLN